MRQRPLSQNGPLILCAANLCFALVPLAVKWSALNGASGPALTFYRHLFAFLAVLALAALGLQPIEVKRPKLLLWRGLLGGASVFLWFASLDLTSAAKGTVLNYTHTLWSNVFGALFLGLKRPRSFWPLFAVALGGLYLVVNPDFDRVNWGDVMALGSGMFGGAAVLTVKEARKTENALTIFGAFSAVGLVIATLYLWLAPRLLPSQPASLSLYWQALSNAWLPILVMSAAAVGGQLLFTHGYAYTSIAVGSLLSLSVPLLASLGGHFILHEALTPHFVMGALLVLGASLWLGIQESAQPAV